MKRKLLTGAILLLSSASYSQYEMGWDAQIAGSAHDDCRGMILVDDSIYVAGRLETTAEFISTGVYSTVTSAGADDIFVAKLDKDGAYQWAHSMGGTLSEQAVAISADASNNIYVIGFFESDFDMDPSAGVSNVTSAGEKDMFVTKFDANGNFVWSKQMGGALTEQAEGITVLSDGLVITGRYKGTFDSDPGAGTVDLTAVGNNDIFVIKLDLDGNFVWSKSFGSTGNNNGGDIGWAIAKGDMNSVYITGVYKNTMKFDAATATSEHTAVSGNDVYLLKLAANGDYVWSKTFGGTGNDNGSGVYVDATNNVYVTGFYEATVDFDPSATTNALTSAGMDDSYLVKFDKDGNFQWVNSTGSTTGGEKGKALAFNTDNIYYVGTYSGMVTIGTDSYTSNGGSDCFIQKLDFDGNVLWSKSYGTVNDDFVNAVIVDADTSLYFDGKFDGTMNISPDVTANNITSAGEFDGYIFKWMLPVVSTVGINTLSENNLAIYPNPATSVVNVELPQANTTVNIVDHVGKQVNATMNIINDQLIQIDLNNLENGVYFVIVEGKSYKVSKL